MVGASSLQEVNYCSTIGSNDQPDDQLFQANLPHALAISKDLVPQLFQRSRTKIKFIIEALFELLRRTVEPVRPGRQYPPNHRVSVRKYVVCHKPIS